MRIDCTGLRISPEDAAKLCKTENNGLLGRAADWVRGGPQTIEILASKQFYHPYYCVRLRMQLPRSQRVRNGAMEANMVVDGVFGMVQGMEGIPQTEGKEVPAFQVAQTVCSRDQAADQVKEFIRKYLFRKYHAYPAFEPAKVTLVYKPLYAMCCRKRKKQYYQIVDGEMGSKDYTLDIRYPKIKFCAEEPR